MNRWYLSPVPGLERQGSKVILNKATVRSTVGSGKYLMYIKAKRI